MYLKTRVCLVLLVRMTQQYYRGVFWLIIRVILRAAQTAPFELDILPH